MNSSNNKIDLYNNEYDSEDDDGFFLTPVLHYDISNKIKEANKMLFESEVLQLETNTENVLKSSLNKRCVTFAKDLVSYEPIIQLEAAITSDDDELFVKEELEISKKETATIENINELKEILDKIDNNMIIEEENNKSLLILDPPYPEKCKLSKKMDDQITHNNDNKDEIVEIANNLKYEDDLEDDTISMQVGIIARSQIRNEIKKKNCSTLPQNQCCKKKTTKNNHIKYKNDGNTAAKFNYKTCCEYQQSHLPRYKGHISEYGLTLRERERMLQLHKRQERNLLDHETRIQAETMRRLTANEQAFNAWLLKKCRNAPNRIHNMFDSKPKVCKRRMD